MPRRRKYSEDNNIVINNNNNNNIDDDLDNKHANTSPNKTRGNLHSHRQSSHHNRSTANAAANTTTTTTTTSSAGKKLHKLQKPLQRNAANARERSRMRVLSKAFSKLKTTLPWVPPDTKLSKLDTLRLASSYIAHLRQILDAEEAAEEGHRNGYIHPLNLTWPFTFNGRTAALNEGKSPEPMKCPTKPQGSLQC